MKGAGEETLLLLKFAPLVERMLAQCPSKRPTMQEVVAEVMELVVVDRQRAVEQRTTPEVVPDAMTLHANETSYPMAS